MLTVGFPPFAVGLSGVYLLAMALFCRRTPRSAAVAGGYVALLLVFRFTFFPLARDNGGIAPAEFFSPLLSRPDVNIRLFATVRRYLPHAVLFVCNIFGNVALFLPCGFFLPMLFSGRKYLKTLLFCALLSLSVELLQLFLPSRCCDIDDFFLNMLGAVVGVLLGAAFLRARHSFFCCS